MNCQPCHLDESLSVHHDRFPLWKVGSWSAEVRHDPGTGRKADVCTLKLSLIADDAGGSQEGYVKWMCETVHRRGFRSVVLNFRGCGGITLTTPRCYSAVFTDDIHEIVHYLQVCVPATCACRSCPCCLSC